MSKFITVYCFSSLIYLKLYCSRYQNEFGFILSGRKIYVDDIRVRGIGKTLLNIDSEALESQELPIVESVGFFFFILNDY